MARHTLVKVPNKKFKKNQKGKFHISNRNSNSFQNQNKQADVIISRIDVLVLFRTPYYPSIEKQYQTCAPIHSKKKREEFFHIQSRCIEIHNMRISFENIKSVLIKPRKISPPHTHVN